MSWFVVFLLTFPRTQQSRQGSILFQQIEFELQIWDLGEGNRFFQSIKETRPRRSWFCIHRDSSKWRNCCCKEIDFQHQAMGGRVLQWSQFDQWNSAQESREAAGLQHWRPWESAGLWVCSEQEPRSVPFW